MKKLITIFLLSVLLCGRAFSQGDTNGYVHKGLLRASLTFAVGAMTSVNITNAYLTGNMEYYTDSKISVRGDIYYFFNSLNNEKLLKQNHALYFGGCYNIPTHSHFDPMIGFQPGIALSQVDTYIGSPPPGSFSPLGSIVTGFNFYGEKWFHILVNVRYTMGKHLDNEGLFSLNEISFSFGLGWNIDVIKQKPHKG